MSFIIKGGGALFNTNLIGNVPQPVIPSGLSPDWLVGSGGDFATLQDALASPSVVNGNYIKVLPGTYTWTTNTLVINKQVYIGGTPGNKSDVILQSSGSAGDPGYLIQICADNVVLKDLTIKHKKLSALSIDTAILLSTGSNPTTTRLNNFIMDSCRVEHVETGLVIRGNNFKVANTEVAYVGPNNTTRNHVILYGSSGSCFFTDNVFEDSTIGAITGNTNCFLLTSTTGTDPAEKYTGTLVIDGSTWTSSTGKQPNQFFLNNNNSSESTINIMFKNNVMNEKNAFTVFFGSSTNFGNIYGDITYYNNTLSNLHNLAGKGMLGIDGLGSNVAFRSTNLVAHIDANTITNATYRADYTSVYSIANPNFIGRKTTAIASFGVTGDAIIPATPPAPSTPNLL